MSAPVRGPDERPDAETEAEADPWAEHDRMAARKKLVLRSHCCSVCGTGWRADNTWFCVECGTAYGSCCVNALEDLEGPPEGRTMRRCGCGGVVT